MFFLCKSRFHVLPVSVVVMCLKTSGQSLEACSYACLLFSRDQSPSERAKIGIKDNLVRFSCGIEDYEDILADLQQALKAV